MPRPKKDATAAGEAKKRSRTGCWQCKARKIKCGEEKPSCLNCTKNGEAQACDYSIRLNWSGRQKDPNADFTFIASPSPTSAPQAHSVFSAQHITPASGTRFQPPPERPPLRTQHSAYSPQQHQHQHQHDAKRVKLEVGHSPASASANSPPLPPGYALPNYAVPTYVSPSEPSPPSINQPANMMNSVIFTPATPASSHNSGSPSNRTSSSLHIQDPPDLRRLSVKSLLSDPSDDADRPGFLTLRRTDSEHRYRTHGYDHGLPDLDVPRNDDHAVVLPRSPDLRRASAAVSEISVSSGEVDPKSIAFESGGYYATPVAVKIARFLEPLPRELLENQMNLLYFHHFINHTGRILVPHDCPQNPFRTILPQMAVRNPQLLHLMLAFSASHRARLLDHPEPVNRIAGWMSDVLPELRRAVAEPVSPGATDPRDPSSLAPLATAVMFASLEIVSPSTFAPSIRWQDHLQIARQMIVSKGGLHHLAQKADGARDKAIFFLSRWFAYLDVLGSLSGSKHEQPLYGAYWEDGGGLWLVNRNDDEVDQIDCFFGFSGRCISLLAQVAELATQCDHQRIDPITNQIKGGWRPNEDVRQSALELVERLRISSNNHYRGCMHVGPEEDTPIERNEQDVDGIRATNMAWHWAGIIHLQRRVLALPSSHNDVQESVQRVIDALNRVRRGSSAESCLLFPMFSAGCEAQSEDSRRLFMDRLKDVEGWGIDNFAKARNLMQRVWDTKRPWETMVDGEFLG